MKNSKKNRGMSGDQVRGVGGGVRVDLNAMLGVGVMWGMGGCESRIERFIQCTKRYCTILRQVAQRATIAHLRASKYFKIVLK